LEKLFTLEQEMFEKRAPYIGIIILSNVKQQYGGCINCIYIYIYIYTGYFRSNGKYSRRW